MPASRPKRTRSGRSSEVVESTSADRTPVAQSGYDSKSAIAAMTVERPAATVMLAEVLSAMTRSVPPGAPPARPAGARPAGARPAPDLPAPALSVSVPLQNVGHPGGPEVAHVDALGHPDPNSALQRLVHVAEQHVPRLGPLDRGQQGLAPPLHPAGHRVVEQIRHGRRNVRAEHVDLADSLHLGR